MSPFGSKPASRGARRARHARPFQRGATLIEGLIAITIFSLGILAVVGMMTTHMSTAGDARYRVEAAQFAESILADMRTSDANTLQATFTGPDGAGFTKWEQRIADAGIPMANAGTTPQLEIDFADATTVTVRVRWRAPASTNEDFHQYLTTADLTP